MKRSYYWSNKAYYGKYMLSSNDEVLFGLYDDDGAGTSGEMAMRWEMLGGVYSPRLEVHDDAWAVLAEFTDLINELANHDNEAIQPADFVEILKELGFADRTKYDDPYEEK